MFELFKLIGRVIIDTFGANQALDETNKKAEKTTSEIGQYVEKLKNWAAGLLTVSSVVSGLKKVWEVSAQVAELGDSIDKNSKKFLLSTQAYQKWMYIGEHYSFTIEQVGNAVVDLSKKVGSGSEDVLAMLEEIGISAAAAMTATPEALFEMVVSGLQNMEDSTRKAYIADGLLGGAAKDLGAFLESNAEDAQALEKRMDELGGTMSDSLIGKSAEYQDSVTDLKYAWQGVKNDLAEETVPAMTEILNGLTQMLTGDFVEGLETAADGVENYLTAIVKHWADFSSPFSTKVAEWIAGAFDWLPGVNATESLDLMKKASDAGTTWWDDAGYISNPYVVPGNADDVWGGTTFDAAPWAFEMYRQVQAGGSAYDMLDMLEEKFGTNNMEAVYDAYDRLLEKIDAYEKSGGQIDDFWAEMQEIYGSAVDGCAGAVNKAADTWNQSAADVSAASSDAVAALKAAADNLYAPSSFYGSLPRSLSWGFPHASGLEFVPRDDYPARLHYGERVLTRQENEEYNAGRSGGSTTIHIQTVAQSPAQTAAAITAALARARWAM